MDCRVLGRRTVRLLGVAIVQHSAGTVLRSKVFVVVVVVVSARWRDVSGTWARVLDVFGAENRRGESLKVNSKDD